ncbi:MAG: gliding motility-associated C-terminal domain-containing protein [Saprospiraceae bacterium]|nr:gliding motility-associated C-terminal domain-containing protein [Saprospiraceae bacterium]
MKICILHKFLVLSFALYSLLFINISSLNAQCKFSDGPPGEICTSAHYVCDFNGFTGRLPDSLSVPQPWKGCNGNGQADNIVWFSFTPTSNRVTFLITPSNCTVINNFSGMQAGIYSSCRESAALDCTDKLGQFNGITTPFLLTSDQFTPCEPGFLFLDGYARSICDFQIEVIEGIDNINMQPPPDLSNLAEGFITGPTLIECNEKNTPVRYNITPPECIFSTNPSCGGNLTLPPDSVCFEWKVSPITGAQFAGGFYTGTTADIIFTQSGDYTITAEVFIHPFYGGSCGTGGCSIINEWKVLVKGQDSITLSPVFLCPGQNLNVCGQTISSDTTITCVDPNDICRVLTQEIIVGASKTNELGKQYICTGDAFNFQGSAYTSAGDYEVLDISDCTLLHKFSVEVISISSQVLPGLRTLDCNNTTINLSSEITSVYPIDVVRYWKNSAGDIISFGNDATVNQPGIYFFSAELRKGDAECLTDDIMVSIEADFVKPILNINKPSFNCLRSKGIITVTSSRPLFNTEWILPIGPNSTNQNLFVDSLNVLSGGDFHFSAEGSNGCKVDTTIRMTTDFAKPALILHGEDLTCYKPVSNLSFTSDIGFDSIRWIRDDNFQQANILIYPADVSGMYRLELRAASSKCWNDETKFIADNKIRPFVEVGQDLVWHCNTESFSVIPQVSSGLEYIYNWQSNNGVIASNPNDSDLLLTSTGTYVLEVFNTENGCSSNDVFSVNRETNVPIEIDISVADPLCYGELNGLISIDSIIGGFNPYTITLNGNVISQNEFTDLRSGVYNITAKDKNGCIVSGEVTLIDPEILELEIPLEINLAYSENLPLRFTTNYSTNDIVFIEWKNEQDEILGTDFTLDYHAFKSEDIFVEIENMNGCRAIARTRILVDTELELFIPNIFSPNGDGVNDRLIIGKNKIPANIDKISIYDRYGNMVYAMNNFPFNDNEVGWDGHYQNRRVEQGVYIMVMQVTDFLGQKQILKKDLTIIH